MKRHLRPSIEKFLSLATLLLAVLTVGFVEGEGYLYAAVTCSFIGLNMIILSQLGRNFE